MVPKGPQMDPKSRPKSITSVFWRVSKRNLKKGPSPGSEKVRFCYYLLHFSKVGGLKKDQILGTMLGTVWETKLLKTGFQSSIKKVLKIDTHFTRFWVHFGDNF